MVRFATERPLLITGLMLLAVLALAAQMPRVNIDTDPENMLARDDPVRVLHDRMKEEFAVHDMIVVGVVNEGHPDGVFNPDSLRKIYALTEFSMRLRGKGLEPGEIDHAELLRDAGLLEPGAAPAETPTPQEPPAVPAPDAPGLPVGLGGGEPALPPMGTEPEGAAPAPPPMGEQREESARGVVVIDLLAPSTVDRIYHEAGTVHFSRLMEKPLPEKREDALEVYRGALDNPLLRGTVVSEDGKAVCLYLPITQKNLSYRISQRLGEFIARLGGPEDYHITGLPVAEDTFGHEMFVQMAISAPLAMLVIFVLLLVFFRKVILILSPMIVALVSVICTMGLLIGLGYTVHIMSSMIPIFIMPIAVLDAIHILSEFFDRYQATRDRRATILNVMEELFVPMLYTSLTSAAGFASLALTPIPPVQVFGVFVAFGIMTAWLLTVTFIPAYVMFIPERRLAGFGVSHAEEAPATALSRLLRGIGRFTHRGTKLIITGALLVLAVAIFGVSRIRINDNPTKWFVRDHPIRLAERVLNGHLAGTYQAYLALTPRPEAQDAAELAGELAEAIREAGARYADRYREAPAAAVFEEAARLAEERVEAADAQALSDGWLRAAEERLDAAEGDDAYAWDEAIAAVQARRLLIEQPLKRPDLLRYIDGLQQALAVGSGDPSGEPVVGKSNSVVDIVKKVHRELRGGPEYDRVPDNPKMVAETLFQFGNSHTPDDLWHFVTPDFTRANLWLQLKSGDNRDMERIVDDVERYLDQNRPPVPLDHDWFGLTYINVAWQQKMVSGMLQAFLGSFVVVFILMTVLFHSALWGILSMIPLTLTIALIYGLIGLAGKDYDMPVAVLSSLTLGLAVDFAIHFLARSREAVREHGSWGAAATPVFGEPARAISRNAIVVAIGFLPLLAAPLVPYKTVGAFMAGILAVAAVGTLLILPALITVLQRPLFGKMGVVRITCNCVACVALSVAAVVLLALNFHQHWGVGWGTLAWVSVVTVPLLVFACGFISRRRACRMLAEEQERASKEE